VEENMDTLKKTFSLLTPHELSRGILVLLLVMGMALLETVGVASVMPFLAVLGNPEMLNTNPALIWLFSIAKSTGIKSPDDFLILLGLGAFLLIVVSASYRIVTHYIMNNYIEMRRHSISSRLLQNYLRQPYGFFLNRHSSEMSSSILSEVDQVVGNIFRPAFSMFASSLVLFTITALLLIVNFWLTLIAVFILTGLYALVFLSLRHKLSDMGGLLLDTNKKRFKSASEVFGGIKDIKLLGCEQIYLDRFSKPSMEYATTHANHHTFNQIPSFLIEAIIFGALLLLTLTLMMSSNGLNSNLLGQILPIIGLYSLAAYRLKPAVHHIYEGLASLRYGHAVINNLHKDLNHNNFQTKLPETKEKFIKPKHFFTIDNISYTYPNSTKPALEDLFLEIPVNSMIGIVGSTGAGKTTLVDVILGLLRTNNGQIKVDDVAITDSNLRAWQKSLGYVPQNIFLTDNTITENIALGVPIEQINFERVTYCARMAQIYDFVMKDMPSQFSTLVGERGVRLSGGQRQRIGIARALYNNPEVLIFDEATSSLDTITERAVMEAIDNIAQEKIIIIIAHRLSTVKNCDQILLLEKGKIKIKGIYSELILKSSQFKKMAE
tara:strand:- start:7100 stop:8920 length:1821 start_codon:yes stop_codon:yes gene_type:complete